MGIGDHSLKGIGCFHFHQNSNTYPPPVHFSPEVGMGDAYKVRSDSVEVITSRFNPKAGKILTEKKWRAAFDKQGRLDISKVLIRIQGGGVHPSIRAEVWEFLLGCFPADSTYGERDTIRKHRRDRYSKMKAECRVMDSAVGSGVVITLPRIKEDGGATEHQEKSERDDTIDNDLLNQKRKLPRSLLSFLRQDDVSGSNGFSENGAELIDNPNTESKSSVNHKTKSINLYRSPAIKVDYASEQQMDTKILHDKSLREERIIQWRLTLHQIGLDVVRTDRTLEFYEKPSNLSKLWDILAVYSWLDPEVGYCQGMSDLCSPMVLLFPNEADAFWCFERLMHRLRENFKCTEQAVGVQRQLMNLGMVLQVIDPKLHKHLDDLGGGSFIFAFRMLMVLFRREFSFSDCLYLWEIMWSLEYDPDLCIPEQQQRPRVQHDIGSGWIIRKGKSLYRWGKFERQNIKYGQGNAQDIPFVVFCAASIFESQRLRLQEAPGLDEVLKLLNDITGKLDAKKACKEALKLHKKYLLKVVK